MIRTACAAKLLLLALALALLVSCSTGTALPPTASPLPTATSLPSTPAAPMVSPPAIRATATNAPDMPQFDRTTCPFSLPGGQTQGKDVDCGFVVVPEVHAKPNGPRIRLALARFRNRRGGADPSPIIYLSGGPGARNQGVVSGMNTNIGQMLTETHDVIIFDPRGVGHSQPALECPEVAAQTVQDYAQNLPIADEVDRNVAATLRCRDRLIGQGITLSAYTTAESAADVADIRVALGATQLNLLGVSYGTRWAQTVMRDHPESVLSVVLDSVIPLNTQRSAVRGPDFERALKLDLTECVTQMHCPMDVPTLQTDFVSVFAQLNARPVTVAVTDPKTLDPHDVVVTGYRFVALVHDALSIPQYTQYMPAMIVQLKDGESAMLANLVRERFFSGALFAYATGMQLSAGCSESAPFENQATALDLLQGLLPPIRDYYAATLPAMYRTCAQWPVAPPLAIEHQAVTSDLPTLVLESRNDPVTPPADGQLVLKTLKKSAYVETPGIGHSVFFNGGPCATRLILDFFGDPTRKPDTACTAGLGINYTPTG